MKNKKPIETLTIRLENRKNYILHEFLPMVENGEYLDYEKPIDELKKLWNEFVVKDIYQCETEEDFDDMNDDELIELDERLTEETNRIWKHKIKGMFRKYIFHKGIDWDKVLENKVIKRVHSHK